MKYFFKNQYEKHLNDILQFVRDKGLDPKETIFIPVENETLFYVISNLYPVALPHWTRGRNYLQTKTSNERGSTYYEVVFNASPYAIAYMSELCSHTDILVVIAHVFGHTHIYKHNIYEYNEHDVLPRLKNALELYEQNIGYYSYEELDEYIDFVNALWNVIYEPERIPEKNEENDKPKIYSVDKRFLKFANQKVEAPTPKEIKQKGREKERKEKGFIGKINFYEFIINNSPIDDWIKEILRAEIELKKVLYRKSSLKILHEGFASWIDQIYSLEMLEDKEFFESLITSSRVGYASFSNPYWLGYKLLKFAEEVDDVFLPDFVKEMDDYELVSRYLNKEFLLYITKSVDGFIDAKDIQEILSEETEEDMRKKIMSNLFIKRPLIYISDYDLGVDSEEHYDDYRIIKVITHTENAPLKLESPDALDYAYAYNTIKKIAKVWRGPVLLKYRRP